MTKLVERGWAKIKEADSLLKVQNDQLQIIVDDYLF